MYILLSQGWKQFHFFLYLAAPPFKQSSISGPFPFSVDIVYNIILHRTTELDKTEDRQPLQGFFTARGFWVKTEGQKTEFNPENQIAGEWQHSVQRLCFSVPSEAVRVLIVPTTHICSAPGCAWEAGNFNFEENQGKNLKRKGFDNLRSNQKLLQFIQVCPVPLENKACSSQQG